MKAVICVYGLVMSYAFIRVATSLKDANEDAEESKERRDDIIQEVGRSLLGVKEFSESDGTPRRTPPTPPRYMLDLYDRYKSGQAAVQGNTVRSILPMRGKLKGVDMLVFNLTGIHAEEQILQGKLHLFRRKQSRRGGGGGTGGGGRKREAVRIKIFDLSLKSPPHWVDVPKQKNSGWQSFEVTESVIRCRSAQHDGDYLLGVSSESRRVNGKYKPIPIRRIARLSSQPFLIIFSEDRNNRTVSNTTDQETVSPSYEEIREMLLNHRNATEGQRSNEGSSLTRHRRETESDSLLNYLSFASAESSEFETRDNGSMEALSNNDSEESNHTIEANTVAAIPVELHESRKENPKMRKNSKRKKQNEKKDGKSLANRKCQRKNLIVDFNDLCLDSWIVHPRSFNAYYCAGSCTNPLNQANISNHAVIQSVLRANKDFRVNSEKIPGPCCVPSTTRSLSVLYVDKNGDIRLKNFPDAIVESCACR